MRFCKAHCVIKLLVAVAFVHQKSGFKASSAAASCSYGHNFGAEVIYTKTYNAVTICFFHGKGEKDEIRYSNPFVRVPVKFGENHDEFTIRTDLEFEALLLEE